MTIPILAFMGPEIVAFMNVKPESYYLMDEDTLTVDLGSIEYVVSRGRFVSPSAHQSALDRARREVRFLEWLRYRWDAFWKRRNER